MRRFIAVVILILAAASAAGAAEAQFFVERIEVRGLERSRPEIVVNESRLEAGREYGEAEIDEAAWRIRRLPFVRTAAASLEKGSERGRYVLVFTVDETLPFFAGVLSPNSESFETDDDAGAFVGWRWFPGTKNVVYVAAGITETEGVQVGFTRYGLLGSGSVLHLSVEYGLWDSLNENDQGDVSGEALLAVPIGTNDALRLRFRTDGYSRDKDGVGGSDGRENSLQLSWVRDVTDDPIFPRRGFAASAGVEYTKGERRFLRRDPSSGDFVDIRAEEDETALVVEMSRYVPSGETGAMWGSLRLRAGRGDWTEPELQRNRDVLRGTVRFGWAGGPSSWMTNPSRSMRFELGGIYDYETRDSISGQFRISRERVGISTGFAMRTDWAVVRVVAEWFPYEEYRR